MRHPFLDALAAGSLRTEQITTYLQQDQLYLKGFTRICQTLAERCADEQEEKLFRESALLCLEAEQGMQSLLWKSLHLDPPSPGKPLHATEAYMKHETRCVGHPSRLVGLAAALPCNWLYADIAQELLQREEAGRPDHPYRVWIDLYAGEEIQDLAQRWIHVLNRWAESASPGEKQEASEAFAASVRHETAFWEQAYRAPVFSQDLR